eukprot:scaffold410_cov65-Cyclotella_meneghiniana.AAC.1
MELAIRREDTASPTLTTKRIKVRLPAGACGRIWIGYCIGKPGEGGTVNLGGSTLSNFARIRQDSLCLYRMVGSFDPSCYYGSTSGVVMVLPLDLFGIAIHSTIYERYGVEHPGKFYDSGLFRSCFVLQYADRSTRIGCLVLVEGTLLIASLALDSGLVVYILILHTIHTAMESNTLLHFVLSGQG